MSIASSLYISWLGNLSKVLLPRITVDLLLVYKTFDSHKMNFRRIEGNGIKQA